MEVTTAGFDLEQAAELLRRTPRVLDAWLRGLPDGAWHADEGPETWSPFAVLGHLVHGERSDWIPRARTILEHGEARPFDPFDRFAQLRAPFAKSGDELLDLFACERAAGLAALARLELAPSDLARRGRHPELGVVTLGELLATWVVHNEGHVAQIARVLAKRHTVEVGPWKAYLPVLTR